MQDSHSPFVDASEIFSSLVSFQVQTLFRFAQKDEGKFSMALSQIDLYLSSHIDIFSKKFVFFVQNEENLHWWGWIAINPWVKKAKVLYKRNYTEEPGKDSEYSNHVGYVSGLLPCDGMNTKINYRDSLCFIWFLNLAAAYRDIHLDSKLDKMNVKNH